MESCHLGFFPWTLRWREWPWLRFVDTYMVYFAIRTSAFLEHDFSEIHKIWKYLCRKNNKSMGVASTKKQQWYVASCCWVSPIFCGHTHVRDAQNECLTRSMIERTGILDFRLLRGCPENGHKFRLCCGLPPLYKPRIGNCEFVNECFCGFDWTQQCRSWNIYTLKLWRE